MRIFVSYAAEDEDVAAEVAGALSQANHKVFFASAELRGGDDYRQVIQREIRRMDLFVFLLSPHSVARTNYALTELRLARAKWRKPQSRILPVLLAPVNEVPLDARGLTHLEAAGNLTAEVVARVNELGRKLRWRRAAPALRLLGAATLAAALIALPSLDRQRWCFGVSPRMVIQGIETHKACFDSENECRRFQEFARTTEPDGKPRVVDVCELE